MKPLAIVVSPLFRLHSMPMSVRELCFRNYCKQSKSSCNHESPKLREYRFNPGYGNDNLCASLAGILLSLFNLEQVNLARRRRKEEMASLSEAITVVEALKRKMEEEWQIIEKKTHNLVSLENKLRTMKSLSLEGKITVEVAEASFSDVPMLMELVRMEEENALELQLLERGLARSSVKIGFDQADDLLTNLKAQDDSVSLRLCTNPMRDSEKIFMASFLLRQIFKDMISSRNPQFLGRRGATGSNAALGARPPVATARAPASSSSAPSLPPAAKPPTPSPPRPTSSKSSSAVASKVTRVDPALDRTVAISNRPRAFLKMQVESETPFRVVVELRPDLAPNMVDNFLKLCRGLKDGRGYKGSQVKGSRNWSNSHLVRFSAAFPMKGLREATLRRMMAQAAILPSLRGIFSLNRWN